MAEGVILPSLPARQYGRSRKLPRKVATGGIGLFRSLRPEYRTHMNRPLRIPG